MTRRLQLSKGMHLVRKFGLWGFLFFLLKGLVWLAIAAWGLCQAS